MGRGFKETIKTVLREIILPAAYSLHKKKHKDRLVIFSDCHNESCPYSMRYLYDMAKKTKGIEVCGIFHDYSKGSFYSLRCALDFMKVYGRAAAVVICDNHLPVASAKKDSETFVVQLWHSGGAFKKFGYDSEINIPSSYRGGNVFSNYDLVTVSAEYAIAPFVSAMRQDSEKVRAIGTSRSDYMFDEAYKERIRKKFYDEDESRRGKKIILYAPTFRGSAGDTYEKGFSDIEEAARGLGGDFCVIKKPHPHDRHRDRNADSALSSEELLVVCDLLITDYSSIIYDYSLLGGPMLLYVPDYDDYSLSNGFYEDFDSIPGIRVFTKERLKDSIYEALSGKADAAAAMMSFADRTMAACDGTSSERILNEILDKIL